MLFIVIICISIVVFIVFYVNRLFHRLDKMLDVALDGKFKESTYDESQLSKFESKLARCLNSSRFSKNKLEEEKLHIQEMISDVSHQVKTPITNIMLYSELLEESLEREEDRKMLKQISGQADKLNFLLQSLVKISRLETQVFQLVPVEQPLQPLLSELRDAYYGKAKEKSISISVAETGARAKFDYKWTKEALGNMIDNAIKYTESGGSIHIEVKEYEMFQAVEINDTGIGIAEEEQASIFKRFYRSESVNQYEGVGIGLFLARKIISLEGGYIKVSSEVGKGSKFSVYLMHF